MKIRKELWFGLSFMALIVGGAIAMLVSVETITNGHLGLLMLSLVVVAIMLGFPHRLHADGHGDDSSPGSPTSRNTTHTLDLMVQSAYKTMTNDVLIVGAAVRLHGLSGRARAT